ncbi:MAG: HNH endonuclease [Planctomycetota bacterium]|nr:HNH endonuclease [Planctomycetota bacterium]
MSATQASFFERDLVGFGAGHVVMAKAIYDYCTSVLGAEVHYRKERYDTGGGGQKQTIFWLKTTRNFFALIDLERAGRLRIAFPDKDNLVHDHGAQWMSKRQGETGKRAKFFDLPQKVTDGLVAEVLRTISRIHDNALQYYLETHDSTKTWTRMFGIPSGKATPLPARGLTEQEFQAVYGDGRCRISGTREHLEIGWLDGKPVLVSATCNPTPSRFIGKALNCIPVEVRETVWHRDGGACTAPGCGCGVYIHFDHLIPRSKGGSNTENNIVLKCRSCNLSKSGRLQP